MPVSGLEMILLSMATGAGKVASSMLLVSADVGWMSEVSAAENMLKLMRHRAAKDKSGTIYPLPYLRFSDPFMATHKASLSSGVL